MSLDIAELMAFRAEKGLPEMPRPSERQVNMFEEIEDGGACRCPACMGLALPSFIKVTYGHADQPGVRSNFNP